MSGRLGEQTDHVLIVFLLGPSGAGKTTLGDALVQHSMLHANFDRPDCVGVDRECLRTEWNAFLDDRNPLPLAEAIRSRVQAAGRRGAVVTCPSGIVPSTVAGARGVELPREYLTRMAVVGLCTVILHGSRVDCIASFLRRESAAQSGRGPDWWDANNAYWHRTFQPAEFSGDVLPAFTNGRHRPVAELVAEIRTRLGM